MADIDISSINFSNLSRKDVEKQFAGDNRLDKILTIFDKVNTLDGNNEGTLSDEDFVNMGSLKLKEDKYGFSGKAFLEKKFDENVTDYELTEYFKDAKESYGNDVEIEDYRKFLGFAASKGTQNFNNKLQDTAQKYNLPSKVIERLGLYEAKNIKPIEKNGKKIYELKNENFGILCDESGKVLETSSNYSEVGGGSTNETKEYDESGNVKKETTINKQTGEQTQYCYGKNPDDKDYKIDIKNGVTTRQSHTGTDDPYWKNMKLEDVVFNAGKADSTKVSFQYDENNQLTGIDIKDESAKDDKPRGFMTDGKTYLTHIPKKTTIDSDVAQSIKKMIDGGARYGEDFDLKIIDGKLQAVPKIKNETGKEAPPLRGEALNKYKDLVSQGIHQNEDFEVEYDKDGNFKYNYKNNQAREFDADYKSEVYDKDGKFLSSLTVKDGEVISEKIVNGIRQVSKMSYDDAILQLILEGDFDTAGNILGENDILSGGYDIYKPADKYKELTGRDLIADVYDAEKSKGQTNLMSKLRPQYAGSAHSKEEAVNDFHQGYKELKTIIEFDPYKSQIAHMLPKIQRVQNDKNSFTEQVNNDKFDVKTNKNKLTVAKNNGKELTIDISKFSENYIKNTISKVNSAILYDIAASGTHIALNEDINGNSSNSAHITNGNYTPSKKTINLDPNATGGYQTIRTLSHEAGHMCDHIDNKENAIKAVKEQLKNEFINFGQDKPLTIEELLQKQGTFQSVSLADEKLKESFDKEYDEYLKNRPKIDSNAEYALTNTVEFFAESYCLLNTGKCKSEYVIANHFPKSFARVKEIMEQNRATRE